jgi:hypothetical protein
MGDIQAEGDLNIARVAATLMQAEGDLHSERAAADSLACAHYILSSGLSSKFRSFSRFFRAPGPARQLQPEDEPQLKHL